MSWRLSLLRSNADWPTVFENRASSDRKFRLRKSTKLLVSGLQSSNDEKVLKVLALAKSL